MRDPDVVMEASPIVTVLALLFVVAVIAISFALVSIDEKLHTLNLQAGRLIEIYSEGDEFYGCSGFPECRYTENLEDTEVSGTFEEYGFFIDGTEAADK